MRSSRIHPRAAQLSVAVAALTLVVAGCASTPPAAEATDPVVEGPTGEIVYFDLSGGTAVEALQQGIFANFTDDTGVPVTPDFGQTLAKLQAAVEAKQVPWSLAQMTFLPISEKKGLLQPIDKSIVPVDQLREGTYDDYSIEYGAYGMAIAFSLDAFPKGGPQPTEMSDIFDTEAFPGKRCFMEDVRVGWVLEGALQADGVKSKDLYPIDLDRALDKLSTIKSDILWAGSAAILTQNFENGSCSVGLMSTGAARSMIEEDGFPADISWSQAGYASSSFGIPVGAPNPEAAQHLLAAIIADTEGQMIYTNAVASPIPTGLKDFDTSKLDKSVLRYVPVGENIDTATPRDNTWYLENQVELTDRLNRFRAG